MKTILNNAVSLFVIVIVLLLIIPLSPFVLDVMFIMNIAISLVILMISMNISESLEFSIFPSLLLITTLFRLGLNISSTRLILTKQGEAGAVIKAFGVFVLQGNVVVGFLIFIIIVLVQFIVIRKGAESVAEVGARFTLDAMPVKQIALDADLSSGLINEQEAKERRYKIQKEADFYGAMDGATKIVKGDAVMSIIITLINFIAGTIIGIVQSNMSFADVLDSYHRRRSRITDTGASDISFHRHDSNKGSFRGQPEHRRNKTVPRAATGSNGYRRTPCSTCSSARDATHTARAYRSYAYSTGIQQLEKH